MKRLGWWILMSALGAIAARGQEEAKKESAPAPKEAIPTTKDAAAGDTENQSRSKVADETATVPPPNWVHDAQWYFIEVALFRNGDSANDKPQTLEWGRVPTRAETLPQDTYKNPYGGDLQGLRQKLPYLKELGINALLLGGVFPDASRKASHDDQIPIIHVRADIAARENEKRSDELSPVEEDNASDQLFRDFLKEAHAQGFRVVVGLPLLWLELTPMLCGLRRGPLLDEMAPFVADMSRKWLRRDNEPATPDGVDGWWVPQMHQDARREVRKWRENLKSINPECVLIAHNHPVEQEFPLLLRTHIDAFIHSRPVEPVIRFFQSKPVPSAADFLARLKSLRNRDAEWMDPGCSCDRLMRCLAAPDEMAGGKEVTAPDRVTSEVVDRWRLIAVLGVFSLDASALRYGEEVGFYHEGPPVLPEPMWWTDLENPESKKPTYRGDFYALIQMLNVFRARFAPLRRGDFKPVLADDEKKLLAFSRSLPGDDVILVMNYGDTKQPIKLTVANPGDLIPILSPQLKPMPMPRKGQPPPPEPDLTKLPVLRVGAQREYVKPDGTIDFWVDPMGVRIVLIGESAQVQRK